MRKVWIGLFALAISGVAVGQEAVSYKKRPTIAIHGGFFDFRTAGLLKSTDLANVLGNNQWSKTRDMDVALGLSYINGLSEYFDYSVNFFTGPTRYADAQGVPFSRDRFMHSLDASLHLKLLTDKYIVVPYLSAGVGGSLWDRKFSAFAPVGAGMQVRLFPEHFLFTNFQYRLPVTAEFSSHFQYSLGFGIPVGKETAPAPKPLPAAPTPPPPPPPPAPVDTDGDGVVDTEDKCPTVKGLAKYQGCPIPDTDGDGINDEEDKCPTVRGIAKYQGCPIPDTDGDGINDEEDKCPSVRGLAKYQGCPIPDSDGDGVNDEEDKCPTVAGPADNKGCPMPANFNAANVLFATGSANLLNVGRTELNKFINFLNENADVKIKIDGHTDNTGNAALNQKLSENRAKAVKTYMVSKGINADRISFEGFGSAKPLADNKTAAGRAKNRRVEFSIVD